MTRMTDHEAAGTLRSTTMFGALGEEPLLKLARACGQRTHRRGQYLWYQDDAGDRLVVICAGLVKVMLASERGDEIVLATAGAGEVLGELAVLDGSPRSASVVAVEDTTVLSLDRVVALRTHVNGTGGARGGAPLARRIGSPTHRTDRRPGVPGPGRQIGEAAARPGS